MHKRIISSILILSILFFSSCSLGGPRTKMLDKDDDDKNADARFEEVIKALENQDKDTLQAMFSKQALDDSDDFESDLDDLFDFFQGDVDTWEKSDGPTVFESYDYGHNIKEVSSYYYVNTDKQKYFFLLRDYPVDTEHPNNVGLYMILLVKAEDEANIWDGDQKIIYDGNKKLSRAGIYIPLK